jgi:hypothetical protein
MRAGIASHTTRAASWPNGALFEGFGPKLAGQAAPAVAAQNHPLLYGGLKSDVLVLSMIFSENRVPLFRIMLGGHI